MRLKTGVRLKTPDPPQKGSHDRQTSNAIDNSAVRRARKNHFHPAVPPHGDFLAKVLSKLQSKAADGKPILDMVESDYFDSIRSGCPDEDTFLEEYMAQPSNDAGAFLNFDLITPLPIRHW